MNQLTPIFIQVLSSAVLFILVWIVIGTLIKPIIRLVDEREAKTAGREKLAADKREEAWGLSLRVDEAIDIARLTGITAKNDIIVKGREQAQAIVDAATGRSADRLERARAEIDRLKQQATLDATAESERLAQEIVGKVTSTTTASTLRASTLNDRVIH